MDEKVTYWEKILEDSENIPQDKVGEINAAIGKISLLKRSKFKQYRGLIEQCRTKDKGKEEKIISPNDLDGYWAICCMQIDQIFNNFTQLDTDLSNNWEKKVPSPKKTIKKVQKKTTTSKPKDEATKKRDEERKQKLLAMKRAMKEK